MKKSQKTKNALYFVGSVLAGAPISGSFALLPIEAANAQAPGGQTPAVNQPLPITDAEIEKLSGPPTRLTVNFQNTPLKEALAEISRQTGCTIEVRDFGGKGQFDDIKLTLQATQMPFWQVMEELLTPQELAVSSSSWGLRNAQGQNIDLTIIKKTRENAEAVKPLARLATIPPVSPFVTFKVIGATRRQTTSATYGGVVSEAFSSDENLSLKFVVMLDPRLKNVPVQTQIVVDTIAYDNGEEVSTLPSRSQFGGIDSDGLVQTQSVFLRPNPKPRGQQTAAQPPTPNALPKPTKITRLTGRVMLALETRRETWEIENVQDVKNLSKTFVTTNGTLKATVVGFWGEEGRYRVPLRIERQKLTPTVIRVGQSYDLFDATFARWPQKGRLLDANGGVYRYGGGGGSVYGGANETASYDIHFSDPNKQTSGPGGRPEVAPLGVPQKLILQVPLEVRQLEAPFEVKDLPLP